jgi:hypothetical protein
MPDQPRNAPVTDLRQRLSDFETWRATNLSGDEKGEAQVFLDRLFQALGWPGVFDAGATLEFRLAKESGGTSFADLLWKPRVLIEMKKAGVDLSRHFRQAFDYWVRAVPDRPRYVILCNFDEFWIYDFENQIDQPVEKVSLHQLSERWESLGFMLPQQVKPIFNNDLVAVTREAAKDVAKVFVSLRDRGVPAIEAQRFALQCVMAMFAEDIGLLPEHSFTRAVEEAKTGSEAYDLIGGLFQAMNTPGVSSGGRFTGTPYFNGGLFAEVMPQELNEEEVLLLREAAATVWSDVRPEIFGTLFEGSMDAGERHASGAHFTSQADIARIVGPVIIQPWHQRIDAATNIDQLNAILEAMSQYRVLDPSVGSGNFLYVAYREMRRLEREVIEKIRERRTSERIARQESFGYITPEQFFGMDVNPFAVEVAKVTMLLGKKLADDEMHEVGQTLPLNNLDKNIFEGDALFDAWPKVDAIIGNPPYLGRRRMVEELGADYCSRLDERFGRKGVADFVTYWFPKAHDHLPEGGRAGFVATKSVKQGDGRKASLDYLVDHDGVIIDAVSGMPWSGEANVTVSIVNWQKGGTAPAVRTLWLNPELEPLELGEITAALSPEVNLRSAQTVKSNRGGVFQGQTLGVTDAFRISGYEAAKFIQQDSQAADVIHPILGGDELLKKTTVADWVIDIPFRSADEAWLRYPHVMKHLESIALPPREKAALKESTRNAAALASNAKAKVNKHHGQFFDRWWTLGWRREDYLKSLPNSDRYIALTRTSSELRGPVFTFVASKFRVADSAVAFPFDSDYALGILQSKVHETWFRERCTTLETRLTYTSKTVFDSFPWPQRPSVEGATAVAEAAAEIVRYRASAFRLGYTLAQQYDVLRRPGKSDLRDLHTALDAAVMALYNFDSEDDLLTQILELNFLTAQREALGEEVTPAGDLATVPPLTDWAWPAPGLDF